MLPLFLSLLHFARLKYTLHLAFKPESFYIKHKQYLQKNLTVSYIGQRRIPKTNLKVFLKYTMFVLLLIGYILTKHIDKTNITQVYVV